MKKLFLIPLLILLFISSCNNKPVYPFPHPMECGDGKGESKLCIPQEVKDYCFFKTGSYWVYIDSLTGTQDCVYVDNSYISVSDGRKLDGLDNKRFYENMFVRTVHSIDQYNETFKTTPNVIGFNANVLQSYSGPGYVGGRQHFNYPFELGTKYFQPNNLKFELNKISKVKVLNKDYSNVFKYYLERDGSMRRTFLDASPEHTYYLSKNIGMVKQVIKIIDTNNSQNTFNRVWLLDRYKIIQ
jgi:hypothetical protein